MLFSYGLLWFAILELFGARRYWNNTIRLAWLEYPFIVVIYYSAGQILELQYPVSIVQLGWLYLEYTWQIQRYHSDLGIPERLSLHGHQNDISSKLW